MIARNYHNGDSFLEKKLEQIDKNIDSLTFRLQVINDEEMQMLLHSSLIYFFFLSKILLIKKVTTDIISYRNSYF